MKLDDLIKKRDEAETAWYAALQESRIYEKRQLEQFQKFQSAQRELNVFLQVKLQLLEGEK
jgi:hypothetical protein